MINLIPHINSEKCNENNEEIYGFTQQIYDIEIQKKNLEEI